MKVEDIFRAFRYQVSVFEPRNLPGCGYKEGIVPVSCVIKGNSDAEKACG